MTSYGTAVNEAHVTRILFAWSPWAFLSYQNFVFSLKLFRQISFLSGPGRSSYLDDI